MALYLTIEAVGRLPNPERFAKQIRETKLLLDDLDLHNMPHQQLWARAIVDKFNAAAVKVLATPAMKAKLKQLAVDPMPMTPAEIDEFVVKELAANGKLIKAAGIN